jgi:putative redox protein
MAILVTGDTGSVFTTRVTANGHEFTADEPVEAGGLDTGPAPYDLLLAALGSCTAMTLRLYAQRRKYPLTSVSVTLEHDRIYAEDCANCDTQEGRVDRLRREIALTGDLTAAQRADLMRIADRCPVHRTLGGEIVVETSEAPAI